jgi:hypothetical protein
MSNNHTPTNRISAMLDETTATQSVPRADGAFAGSAAQPDNEARPFKQPLESDLVGRLIAPLSDTTKQDLLFRQIRDRLIEEFRPTTFSQMATVDELTDDYVRLIRARAPKPQEAPLPLDSRFANAVAIARKKRQRLDEVRKRLESIRVALEFLAGFKKYCDLEHAEHAAELVCNWIRRLETDLTPMEDSPAEGKTPTVKKRDREFMAKVEEFERQELGESEAEWATLRPHIKKFTHRDRMHNVFAGLSEVRGRERDQLQALLVRMRENQEMLEYYCSIDVPQNDEAHVQEPPTEESILEQRYISDLEKSIERKLKSLRPK